MKPQITLAHKTNKKAILRFYKNNHYSASFLGFDSCYVIKDEQSIIASVIISKIKESQENSQLSFLHALVVKAQYQHIGLASQLLSHVQNLHSPFVCFANDELSALYTKNQMTKLADDEVVEKVPEHLVLRFQSYQIKQPQLKVFLSR